jgi:hypothetical protein
MSLDSPLILGDLKHHRAFLSSTLLFISHSFPYLLMYSFLVLWEASQAAEKAGCKSRNTVVARTVIQLQESRRIPLTASLSSQYVWLRARFVCNMKGSM